MPKQNPLEHRLIAELSRDTVEAIINDKVHSYIEFSREPIQEADQDKLNCWVKQGNDLPAYEADENKVVLPVSYLQKNMIIEGLHINEAAQLFTSGNITHENSNELKSALQMMNIIKNGSQSLNMPLAPQTEALISLINKFYLNMYGASKVHPNDITTHPYWEQDIKPEWERKLKEMAELKLRRSGFIQTHPTVFEVTWSNANGDNWEAKEMAKILEQEFLGRAYRYGDNPITITFPYTDRPEVTRIAVNNGNPELRHDLLHVLRASWASREIKECPIKTPYYELSDMSLDELTKEIDKLIRIDFNPSAMEDLSANDVHSILLTKEESTKLEQEYNTLRAQKHEEIIQPLYRVYQEHMDEAYDRAALEAGFDGFEEQLNGNGVRDYTTRTSPLRPTDAARVATFERLQNEYTKRPLQFGHKISELDQALSKYLRLEYLNKINSITAPRVKPAPVTEENQQLKHNYMLLSRLQSDCEYFLNYGNRNTDRLYYKDVDKQICEMLKLYDSFPQEQKPNWVNREQILDYQKRMNTVPLTATPQEKEVYINTLQNPKDIYSGNADNLPQSILPIYKTYEKLMVEYASVKNSSHIAKEDKESLSKELSIASVHYKLAMNKIFPSPEIKRISDVQIYYNNQGNLQIRCKIDGEQQMAEVLTPARQAVYQRIEPHCTGSEKNNLLLLMSMMTYKDLLSTNQERGQTNSMKL